MQGRVFQPHGIAAACALALHGLAGQAYADPFDPASVVEQAYAGPATPDKVNAALNGLNNLITQVAVTPSFGGAGSFSSSFVSLVISGGAFNVTYLPFSTLNLLQAGSDVDFGAPGGVSLNSTTLQILGTFNTPRNFTVGPGASIINTNGFNFTIDGTITTSALLQKQGAGALIVTGANPWGVAPEVAAGVLRGNTVSLATSINNNSKVEFSQANDGVYANVITGTGAVDKTGVGTLTITNANAYGGDTSILAGKLALQGAGSLDGTAKINISSVATFDISAAGGDRSVPVIAGSGLINLGARRLTISSSTDSAFSGVVSGSGGLSKSGFGTLTLSGVNTYTGSTDIAAGTVALAGAGQLAGGVNMSGGVFDIGTASGNRSIGSLAGNAGSVNLGANTLSVGADNSSTGFSGTIAGSGGLVKTGTGTFTLTGTNGYTGDTTINQGELVARTFSLSGNVVNNATLTLFNNKVGTHAIDAYSGNISGSGRLVKDGDDYIWLRGNNNYTGGTEIRDGILIGNTQSLQGNFTNKAGLAFYQAGDGTFTGNIGGNGTVFVYGPGLLTFGGGATAIAGSLANGGRIARGGPLGNITVGGDVLFAPGSSLTIRVDAAGNSDKLAASGASSRVFLQGGTVDVQAGAGAYQSQTRYSIVSATSGVNGQFVGVTSNFAFLTPAVSYDANNVFLTLTRNDVGFEGIAQSGNQSAVGQRLTQLRGGASGDMALVLDTLIGLAPADARRALDSIAASARAGLTQVGALNRQVVYQNVSGRLGLVESGGRVAPAVGIASGGLKLAFEDAVRSDAPPVFAQAIGSYAAGGGFDAGTKHGFWLRGFGGNGQVSGDATNPGFSYRLGGVIAGYDRELNDAVTLGVLGSYSQPQLDQDNPGTHTQTKSYQLGLYGRYRTGAAYVDGVVSYARNPTDTSRSVTVGALNRTATASFSGATLGTQVEAGYTFNGRVNVTPVAGLMWTRQNQNDYTEQGAGALNLVVPGSTLESVRSTLGVRALYPIESGSAHVALEGRAGWAHEFGDQGVLSARLAGDTTGANFSVAGISIPRDSAVLGAGLSVEARHNLRLYADLSGELNSAQHAYGVSAGLRYQW